MASSKWLKRELTKQYCHLVEKSGTTVKNAYGYGGKISSSHDISLLWWWPMTFSCFVDYI